MGKKDVSVVVSGIEGVMSTEIKTEFLRFISAGEKLILDAIDRKEIIANAIVDANYVWKDECRQATSETEVGVYELIKEATFGQMFDNPEKMCLTQFQISLFVKKYNNWLRTDIDSATFFLFKLYNQFLVAFVRTYSDGKLYLDIRRLDYSFVWDAERGCRIVLPLILPQLT